MTNNDLNSGCFKSIPPFTEHRKTRQREVTVQALIRGLPVYASPFLDGNIKVRIIEADQELPVLVDVARIQRALCAFIENARETMAGSGSLTITAGTMKFNGTYFYGHIDCFNSCAFISISDTGPGMSEDALSRIFDPGYEMPGRTGLPVAYHTIKQHNGSINLESKPGQGTTVKIYLPLVQKRSSPLGTIPLPPIGNLDSLSVQKY
jgi:signal transduction histidine kinase